MNEVLECSSCGGTNQLPKGKNSMFCAFCGNVIEKTIIKTNKENNDVSRIKTKPKISKKQKELKITGKEIESLKEIIDWFTDSELESIRYLDLSNNDLQSLKGINKFKNAKIINLDFNNIQELNYLGEFNELKILSLSGNKISKANGLFTLKPLWFDKNEKYEYNFKEEQISSMEYFGSTDCIIYLDNNKIDSISVEFMEHLRKISLNLDCVKIDIHDNPIASLLSNDIFKPIEGSVTIDELINSKRFRMERLVEHLKGSFEGLSPMLDKQQKKFFMRDLEEYNTNFSFSIYRIRTRKINHNNMNKGVLINSLDYPSIEVLKSVLKKKTGYDPDNVKLGACFIATATMGSYDHPQVMELRHFRDEWILTKNWGDSFVKWYYHYGEKAAKVIDKSFVLKKLSYLLIVKPLVCISRFFIK